MLTDELKDKLNETLSICELHHQRMMFAYNNIARHLPLTMSGFNQISPIDLALFDQLIYRFSKLQDSMGNRLFNQLLEVLEEDVSGLPFIDVLSRMEKLNLIDSARDWIKLRQTRNAVSHEYPFYQEIQIEELNLLPDEIKKISAIWLRLKEYTLKRLN
ncbi:hypothetical protein SAMN05444274_102139 [Mariniphaga anaerophila]|uniref:Nucleotidyltransferase substrate binding protein, HI0074 family n=1 Tax=Mariniphaga anaerophila TaxID=1484053 RepID=A0A1M4VMB4_9BACT|nr:hypothetical protein [Mariniphaga anaerophila]SHE69940.1 hypothetical protein SAMN05444274_102139 [Mariniphaga anaerophila]